MRFYAKKIFAAVVFSVVSFYVIVIDVWYPPSTAQFHNQIIEKREAEDNGSEHTENPNKLSEDVQPKFRFGLQDGAPVFCIVMCQIKKGEFVMGQGGGSRMNSLKRQLEQTVVMVKSMVTFSSSTFNFIVITDEVKVFEELLKKFEDWPEKYRRQIVFQHREVWYPESHQKFRKKFRLCATERLFFLNQLQDVDSIVYVDTDVIFLRPPEELWSLFQSFDSRHVVGVTPSIDYYDKYRGIPIFGEYGINAGIIMMNLTRMRSFPNGWLNKVSEVIRKYYRKLILADQDVLNIIFGLQPELAFEMSCQWNYRPKLCFVTPQRCRNADEYGIYLLHGCSLYFHKAKENKFKMFYRAWRDYEVGGSSDSLLVSLRQNLAEVDEKNMSSKCKMNKDIDEIFLKGFQDHLLHKNRSDSLH